MVTQYIGINKSSAKKIQNVQNSCIRYALNMRKYDHIIPQTLNRLRILNMENRRILHLLTTTFKILHDQSPEYLFEKLIASSKSHSHSTRNHLLIIPKHSSTARSSSFSILAPKLWNSLPPVIKKTKLVTSFKTRIIVHCEMAESVREFYEGMPPPQRKKKYVLLDSQLASLRERLARQEVDLNAFMVGVGARIHPRQTVFS